jgi:phage gp36-like protein
MTYATLTDLGLSDEVLTQLTSTTGLIDLERVTAALAAADAIILSYLQQRFATLPPDPVGLLQACAVSLAVHWLYQHCEGVLEIPKPIADARAEAIAWLREVRDGRAGIGVDDMAAAGASEGARLTLSAPPRLFGRGVLDRF